MFKSRKHIVFEAEVALGCSGWEPQVSLNSAPVKRHRTRPWLHGTVQTRWSKLSCRLKRDTTLTSCFRNNSCVAGSSSCMQQHRGPDLSTPQHLELPLALGKPADTYVCGVLSREEGQGPPAGKERWKRNIKTAPQNYPQELGSLCLQATLTCRCTVGGKSSFRQEK